MKIPNSDLPSDAHWDYFGDKYGTVRVRCEDEEGNNHSFSSTTISPSTKAKVYFKKDDKTNPSGWMPNWFYYWRKVVGVPWGQIQTLTYGVIDDGSYAETEVIGGTAVMDDPSGGYNDGTGHRGIHCFGEVLAHENKHILMWNAWWGVGQQPTTPVNDIDSDYYPDTWEQTHANDNFVVGENDRPEGAAGDLYEHVRCYAAEASFNETQYDDKDWSMDPSNVNQGKQWN